MSGGFATEPEGLEAAAPLVDRAAEEIAAALAALRSTLDGLGDYLGPDEQGRAFAAQYDPKATEGVELLGREADALRSVGGGLRAPAAQHRRDDAAGATDLGPTP